MSNQSIRKTIILFDSNTNIEKLKNIEHKNTLIITFDYESHKILIKHNVPHDISDNYINEQDYKKIYNDSFMFARWYENSQISSQLMYDNINLGKIFYIEFHHLLIPILKKFVEIIKILKLYAGNKFHASLPLAKIVKQITSSVEVIEIEQNQHDSFLYDSIKFQLTNAFSINISRNSYLKLKNLSELIIGKFLKANNSITSKSILLVEFDPLRYEKFFKISLNYPLNLVLFNRRRPAIWNKKSFSIIRNSNCRIITTLDLVNKNIKEIIAKNQTLFEKKINTFNDNNYFKTFFSIENNSFWEVIKQDFMNLCKKRILEGIHEIEITKELFKKNEISSILVWSESGFNEQIVIKLAKKENIKVVLIQHGLYWETLENYESNKFEGGFPVESDKLLVWGKISNQYTTECGFSNKTETSGSLIYDGIFDRKSKDSTKKQDFILLATSSPVKNEVFDLSVKTMHNYEYAIEMVCKTILKMNKKLVIKLHPFQEELDITPIVKKFGDKIVIIKVGDILPLIESCEAFLTVDYSTTILEAQILEKPVISILVKDRLTTQTPLIFSSHSCLTTTIEDFENTIKMVLNDSNLRAKLIENSRKFVDNYLSNQGTAVQKTLQFLENYM